jgi:predicted RecA/RadA family phage recombinase
MENYQQPGNVVTFTAPAGGVVSGGLYRIGNYTGVATVDAVAGAKFEMALVGVYTVPKVAAEPWTEGMLVYFNTGSRLATSTTGTTVLVGGAVGTAVNPSTTAAIRLNGTAT